MDYPNIYSEPWQGQDRNSYRSVKVWIGVGYRSLLQVWGIDGWEWSPY